VEDEKVLEFVGNVLIPLFEEVKKVQDEINLTISKSNERPYQKLNYKL